MQLTRQTEYAIRILIELASLPQGEVTQSRIISEKQDVPDKFLKKTVQVLVRAGLVESKRGMQGGVRLAVPANSITIADLVNIVEGQVAINPCLARGFYCKNSPDCRVRVILQRAQQAMVAELGKETIADLVTESFPG